jgi:hypothetical protein
MKPSHLTLQQITANGAALRIHDVKRVLVLHELKLNLSVKFIQRKLKPAVITI